MRSVTMRCCFLSFGALLVALLLPALALAADLALVPAEVPLAGPDARQQLLVLTRVGEQLVGDATARAKFATSNPAVASVDESGEVRAVGNGEAVISATANGTTATAKVRVTGTGQRRDLSFRNHVVPILTKCGCNSGACHGALAGKGGMKLSLRGYDPETDHFVLTRQSLARRIDRQQPKDSLMLKKPTRVLPHGGGKRFEDDSSDYRLLLDWITAGGNGPKETDA